MPFSPGNVKVAAGTLYLAPLGTSEPITVTGAWPAGWVQVGYTDQGSEFDFGPTVTPIDVEEEFYPIRQAITTYSGKITFVMAELTQRNLALAMNTGLGGGASGTNADGSIWQEPPTPGSEVRIMIGWGAEFEGSSPAADPFQRFVWRQCLQTGQVKRVFRKGNNKASYSVEFMLEKPTSGLQPWRSIQPAILAS
jgi:hypothetical protein